MNTYSNLILAFLVITLFACTKDTELIEETKQDLVALTMSEMVYNPCWVDQEMNLRDIPEVIRASISSKYPNQSIEDAERLGGNPENFMAIEVDLNNNIGLLFDVDGNFIAEENESSKIVSPDSIPQSIHSALNTGFPGIPIDEVERKSEFGVVFFEVELSNGVEFLFDEQGQPLCQIKGDETDMDDNDDDDDDDGDNDDDDDDD